MAGSQHTQTHPKYTWRFLSISERLPEARPLVIYVNASREQEARDTMPGVSLILVDGFIECCRLTGLQIVEVRHE
ncbi:TPA: host cell division inhibitor Icd-like protein [Klebsiella michiganensis]|nr:host cell division inhibitor Icd-like protein [Klebsiella michiganensis]HDZ9570167.1 host cell division inhibitor Icd-like protein [Klebsiella pneumoniae]